MKKIFKKKRRMRIFEHRIFSKSFGGKICHNWTDVTYRACEKLIRQKIVQQLIKKNDSPTKSRSNICLRQATNIFNFLKWISALTRLFLRKWCCICFTSQ